MIRKINRYLDGATFYLHPPGKLNLQKQKDIKQGEKRGEFERPLSSASSCRVSWHNSVVIIIVRYIGGGEERGGTVKLGCKVSAK